MPELLKNAARTTLNGNINASVTTLVVTDASTFPTSGNFRLLVDSEIMIVTGVAGTTFTITRAQEGTAGTSHNTGAIVAAILTAGGLDQYISENAGRKINYGVATSRPAATLAGTLYFDTDAPLLQVDTGAAYIQFGPLFSFTTPILANFTGLNLTGITTTGGTSGQPIYISGASGQSIGYYKAVPTAPYTVTIAWRHNAVGVDGTRAGILLYNTSSSQLITFDFLFNIATNPGTITAFITRWNSVSSFNSHSKSTAVQPMTTFFARIRDDNTNRYFDMSVDGVTWQNVYNEGRSDFFVPTSVGWHGLPNHATNSVTTTWLHYKEG